MGGERSARRQVVDVPRPRLAAATVHEMHGTSKRCPHPRAADGVPRGASVIVTIQRAVQQDKLSEPGSPGEERLRSASTAGVSEVMRESMRLRW